MTATKKKVLKTSVIAAIIILIAAAIAIAVYLHQDEKFEKEQNDALLILEERKGDYDEYTIVLSDTSRSEAERFAEKIGATLRITDDGSFATLTLTDGRTIRDVYADDANRKYLSSFSADYKAKVSDILTDEEHRYPTPPTVGNTDELSAALSYLNLGSVWNKTKGSGITVAVIDTGIDTDHPEFAGRISEYSYNATEDKIVKDWLLEDGSYDWSLVEDEQGHGTGVAAALGAASDNAGMVGVAPSVTIIVIKAECNANGEFTRTSDLVFGLYYAIERDVSVVNMSFGTQSLDNPFEAATQLAYDSDVICVASAGNESTASLTYPAADPLVIGVGALASDSWELASYSNYGENVDVVAPGSVYTAKMGGGYKTTTGTSLASPLVAGAVALLCATDKYITYDEVTELLYASSYDLGQLGRDFDYGFGALDAMALIIEERGTLTLDMMTDELEDEEALFIRNHTLQEMLEPERYFAVFDGWYYDPYYTEPYNYYEDKFVSDITLYAKWSGEDDGIPFTYVELSDGTIEIRSYTGRRRYISVPEYIDGKLVTSIGDFAFSGETGLREINLPRGLTKIGRYAFENCMNLVSMEIPEGVTSLGEGAFYNAVRMSGIAFVGSPKLTVIGSEAFAYCSSLRKIEIPEKVTSVYGSAFLGATSLGAINVSKANEKFVSEGGALFNRTKSILIAYPAGLVGNYSVPGGTREIGAYAFAFTRAKDVNLNKAEKVGDSAFLNSYLNGVIIPSSVTVLGVKAFANSYYLSSVTLGSGLSEIPAEAFYCCAALSEIIVPKGITSIGGGAFADSGLASVEFAEGSRLNSIGSSAFKSCMLTELSLPKSLITIGRSAFANNFFLSDVDFGENSNLRTVGSYAFANGSLTEISLPEGLETLGDFAFMNQSITGEVYIPARLTYFGAGAFASNAYLTAFAVDGENSTYNNISGVVYTEDGKELVAYPTGNTATAYSVLTNTETIGAAAFWGARKLTSLTLNAGLISLEEYSLAYMTSLRSIAIPDSVVSIARCTFLANMNMSSISFGADAKIARLGFESLAYTGITSITIPKNVSTIAQYALAGDTKLTSVTFAENSKLESISAYMFDGADNLTSITFKSGSALTSIQAHGLEGMRKLTKIDFGDAKITNIDNFAFRFCEKLTSFTIPETVESIGRYAFYACYGLTSVTIPESVEHIGAFAFLANENLEIYFKSNTLPIYLDEDWDHGIKGYYLGVSSVTTDGDFKYATLTDGNIAILEYTGEATELDLNTLGYGNITVIGGDAFAYSTLENVTLPETLVTIQKEAFYHSALKNITIPASVEFIGNSAFADTPIESLTFADNSSLKVIEQSAFERTENLSGAVEIPASATTLGRAIFRTSAVTTVTFENGTAITEIPEEAFANSGITAFTAPDSVTKIGDGAFRGAKSLKTFAYGTGELWLGANAFYQSGLETLHISENIVMVEEFALTSLENLESFTVSESNPYYKAVDGLLLSKDGKKLISVPAGRTGALTVPASVEIIGFGAFEATALDSVSFSPDSNILSLGYRAFFGAKNIREITIPASVVSIDYYAFAYAKKLEKVTFAEGSSLTGIYEGAFYGCQSLSDITLPDGITEISDFAFYGCSALKNIPVSETSEIKGIYSYAFAYTGITGELILPDTLIDIDNYAFLGTKAEKITIPATNAKDLVIGIGAFEEARNLTEITLPFIGASYEDMDISWFGYIFGAGAYEANSTYVPESLKKVNINSDITFIGMHAFDGLATLEEISVPETVTALYYCAFKNTTAKYELKSAVSLWSIDRYWNPVVQITINDSYFGKGISGNLALSDSITSIGRAFRECSSLTSIVIPDSVETIGGSAFYGCSNLTAITLGKSLSSIGSYAFYGCSSLTSIVISEGVTSIGESAFSGCSSLTSIVIPEGVTAIGSNAFSNCSSLTSVVIPEGVTSIGSYAFSNCGSLTSVVIPEGVTSIGDSAFSGCSSLTSIAIPDSVETIGARAFDSCSSLSEITLGESLSSIGYRVFYGCRSLMSIVIPNSVETIGGNAFYGCSNLTAITLGKSLSSIGYSAFEGCSLLKSIVIPEGVTSIGNFAFRDCRSLYTVENKSDLHITFNYSDYGEITRYAKLLIDKDGNRIYKDADSLTYIETAEGFLFTKDSSNNYKLIAYLGSEETVTLPKDINGNVYEIYEMRGVKKVIIPEGVKKIGVQAFYGCRSLMSIVIPNSVETIGGSAFYGCSNLTEITLGESLSSIGSGAFEGCSSLTSIEIPDSVETIGGSAFNGCSNLTAITLGKSLSSIGWYAFQDCSSLTSIEIPDGVTAIGWDVFHGCSSLKSIVIPDNVTSIGDSAFYGCSSLTSITIPDNVTSIGGSAFSGCNSLTSIVIPANVTSIGARAFSGCNIKDFSIDEENTSFTAINGVIYNKDVTQIVFVLDTVTEIVIPSSVTNISSAFEGNTNIRKVLFEEDTALTSIGFYAFYGCSSLTSIVIPDSVTSIGSYAFYGCSSLTSVVIPDSVETIGGNAFYGCSNLTAITLGKSLSSIGWDAFHDCSSLTSIEIPDGVTAIGWDVFHGCSSLKSIVIPDNVTSIGDSAFYGCSSLTSITIPDNVTSIGGSAFQNSGIISIKIPKNVTSIGTGAFSGCSSLTSVVIPDSVETIGPFAFENCSNLSEITLGESISSIGMQMFRNCSSLTSVVIPDSVKEIGVHAFSGCSSLESIQIPEGVTSIGSYAFKGCSSLTSIVIPDGVTLIDYMTFSDCSSLTGIVIPEGVTTIGGSAFQNSGITSIKIPKNVTSIGDDAFYDCNIKDFSIDEENTSFTAINGVIYNKSVTQIVFVLDTVTEVVIPNTVTDISLAFSGCVNINKVSFEENSTLTSIGSSAFAGCSSLTSIVIPEGVTSIGYRAFFGCSSLTSIEIPDSVETIESLAFYCYNLSDITLGKSLTSIGSDAFFNCSSLYMVENKSDLPITLDNYADYGNITRDAKLLVDKEGNKIYRSGTTELEYIDTDAGFRFMKENGVYKLIAYLGSEETVTLPTDINGNSYEIYKMRGVKNVIIPEGVTSIGYRAFFGCSSLTSIEIPDSVTSIGSYAFYECYSLTSIEIPKGVTSIGEFAFDDCYSLTSIEIPDSVTKIGAGAFYGCSSLTSVEIPDSVKTIHGLTFSDCSNLSKITLGKSLSSIGSEAFYNTAYYNDASNWVDGTLYIGNHLIKVDTSVARFVVGAGTGAIAADAFDECYSFKHLTIGGNHLSVLSSLTNLETLVITEMPTSHCIYGYFGSSSNIPITLKNIVLKSGVRMRSGAFSGLSGITIYAKDTERDTQWDKNFPGWNNGNTVIYGDEWIVAEFYDNDGTLYASEIFSTSQVIRVPYLEIPSNAQYSYIVEGFDMDGDGIVDTIPATSATDISAVAVVRRVVNSYTVTFVDKDGVTPLYSVTLPYGSEIIVPENLEKQGYSFLDWQGYTEGMTVSGDLVITSEWQHEGEGHEYAAPVWVDATCTDGGYNKHICTLCGEWYATDNTEPLGHGYEKSIVAPTCTERGYDRYLCSCGDEYRENYTEALGHSFTEWVVDTPATCETEGLRHHICYVCGTREDEVIFAVGHSYSSYVVTVPTCTRECEILYRCACGDEIIETVEKAGHSYEQKYTSKSFLQILIDLLLDIFFGYEGDLGYYFKCKDCGHIATEDEAISTYSSSSSDKDICEHQLGDFVVVHEANCTESEVEGRICSLCEEVIEARISGNPLGHSFGAWVETLAPTCEKVGTERRDCTECDHYETRDIAATGHTSSEWIVDAEPTCTAKGSKHKECTVCDKVIENSKISMIPHTYTSAVTPPTCTAQGYTTHTCTCGDSYIDSYVEANGHSFGAWVETLAPTCDKVGAERRDCTECDHYETRDIAATGHTSSEWIVDAEPTCTAEGSKHKECTVCDKVIESSKISMIPHTYTSAVTPPTCTAQGYTTHTCICGYSYRDSYTNALGHSFGAWVETLAPTCEKVGTERRDCSVCNHSEKRDIAATGHTSSEWIVDAEPTCTAEGSKHKECTVCDKVIESSKISMIPHTYTSAVTPPTCTAQGYTTHTCICGYSYRDSYTNALGHSFGAWVETLAPTCDKVGAERRDCTECDHYETRDIAALGYLQEFVDAVSVLSKDEQSAQAMYNELYAALQLYAKLTDEEKQQANASFLLLQTAIEDYNAKAETASDEMNKATEIAFAPLSASFTFLAALLFLLKKKFWMK